MRQPHFVLYHLSATSDAKENVHSYSVYTVYRCISAVDGVDITFASGNAESVVSIFRRTYIIMASRI